MTTTQDQQSRAVIEAWNAQADEHNQWEALGDDEKIEWAMQAARALPEGLEPVAHIRKNGFRFNGEIEPQDDSELPLYTAAQVQAMGRVPPGWQAVPVELLKRVEDALGSFIGECDWSQSDMDAWDDLCAHIAAPRPPAAQEGKPLTDEQIDAIQDKHMRVYPATPRRFARMIEAAHDIKDST